VSELHLDKAKLLYRVTRIYGDKPLVSTENKSFWVTLFSVWNSSRRGSHYTRTGINSTHNHTVRALTWQEAEPRFTSDAKPKWFKQP